jgi:hypothetical protein
MNTQMPTQQEIEELVSFLPLLYTEGFTPIEKWCGGEVIEKGVFTAPWPKYNSTVKAFIDVVCRKCWTDDDCDFNDARQMLADETFFENATIDQIKTILTFYFRGERFFDGHWADMIEKGHIRQLLQRLAEFQSKDT